MTHVIRMQQIREGNLNWQSFQQLLQLRSLYPYLIAGLCCLFPIRVFAQSVLAQSNIVPDSTLGDANSVVIPNFDGLPQELITGGAIRGQNLFHSFQEFNIFEGRGAYFANPEGINNIFSRVTGSNMSELFGTLGVNGTANLYLINPNGIIFGQNASLDVGGSFVGTTADGIQFGEQGFFSATEPNEPTLLTVNPSAFFFNQLNPGNITNNSVAAAGLDPSGSFTVFGLRVPDGKSLSLLGGNVEVDGGGVIAFGGTVNFVSLADTGTVNLDIAGDNFRFSFTDLARGNIAIINSAGLLALGNGGGEINLTANNIVIANNSLVETGIASGLGSPNTKAGNISLDASGNITLDNSSLVLNQVRTTSTGNSGDILVNSNNLTLNNSSSLSSLVVGQGDTGNIEINTTDSVTLNGTGDLSVATGIFNNVTNLATGNIGEVNIATENLSINNAAGIGTSNFGQGDSGDLEITANSVFLNNARLDTSSFIQGNSGNINIEGTNSIQINASTIFGTVGQDSAGNAGDISLESAQNIDLIDSFIEANIQSNTVGNAGTINLQGNSISLTESSSLQSGFFAGGQGESGSISLEANDSIVFDLSGIFGDVQLGAIANSSNVNMIAENSVSFGNNSFINTSNGTQGNTVNINIESNSISFDVSSINASNSGEGNGGNISFVADDLVSFTNSSILDSSSQVRGNAGNFNIVSGAISFDSSLILTRTLGEGNGGNISFVADGLVSFTNGSSINTGNESQGSSGNVDIIANSVAFDSSFINTRALGEVNGGYVSIVADGLISFTNNGEIDASGSNGGNISISADTLELMNSSQLATAIPEGLGDSEASTGDIKIDASQLLISDNSLISNQVVTGAVGNNGDIIISADELDIVNNSIVSNINFGQGNSGNISVESSVTKLDNDSNIIVNKIGEGSTGSITVDTDFLELNNSSEFFTFGNLGNITITATENVSFSNESFILNSLQSQTTGNTGNIQINAKNLDLSNSSLINSVNGMGNVGLIEINSTEAVNLNDNSRIRSEVTVFGIGNGGNINIAASDIFLNDNSLITTGVASSGNAGNITLQAENTFSASNSSLINSNIGTSDGDFATGNVGNILIEAKDVSLSNDAQVQAGLFSNAIGEPGTISLQAEDSLSIVGTSNNSTSDTGIFANTEDNSVGNGSDIELSATSILLDNGAVAQAVSRGDGTGGNITIDSVVLSLDNSSLISASTFGRGDAGNIKITTGSLTANNGANIASATAPDSSGNGGTINVEASETIELRGTVFDFEGNAVVESGINTQSRGTGDSGNIDVTTENLVIKEGAGINALAVAQNSGRAGNVNVTAFDSIEVIGGTELTPSSISVDTNSSEDAGNLDITTNQLIVRDGGQISSTTFGAGDAGNLNVDATEISLSGITRTINGNIVPSGLFASVESGATGDGGNLEITAEKLSVSNGAFITTNAIEGSTGDGGEITIDAVESITLDVASFFASRSGGTGTAGDVTVTTSSLSLDNSSGIDAETLTTDGGNINLQITDLITLNNQSRISATAGTAAAGGNGGNVTIDTKFLVAFPRSNSDITANAFAGDGGRIDLTAESIFGIQAGLALPNNRSNDIDASSQFGLDGAISIDTPDVDPARGLDNLPSNLVDAANLITRNCLATADETKLNQFLITGRGGFPADPESVISSDATLTAEWLSLPETKQPVNLSTELPAQSSPATREIIEATGWAFNQQGELVLVSNTSQAEFKIPWLPEHSCSANS